MAKSNNMLLVLTIVLLLISVIGTFTMLSKINYEITPAQNPAVGRGEISFYIIPPPNPASASTTGYMSVTIEAEET